MKQFQNYMHQFHFLSLDFRRNVKIPSNFIIFLIHKKTRFMSLSDSRREILSTAFSTDFWPLHQTRPFITAFIVRMLMFLKLNQPHRRLLDCVRVNTPSVHLPIENTHRQTDRQTSEHSDIGIAYLRIMSVRIV